MIPKFNITDYHIWRGGELPEFTAAAGYDYILAGNGLFLRASNWIADVLENIAPARVAGLPELNGIGIEYKLPPIPDYIFDAVWEEAERSPDKEVFFRIKCINGIYKLYRPEQTGSAQRLSYDVLDQDNVVMEIHTHPKMNAFFSEDDDEDEKGFRLYGVLASPEGVFNAWTSRIGVYGAFIPAPSNLFSEVILERPEDRI